MSVAKWIREPTVAALLAYETEHWTFGTNNTEAAIRNHWGVAPTAYYAALYRAVDTAEAVLVDPVLTHRIIRIREDRRTRRITISRGSR